MELFSHVSSPASLAALCCIIFKLTHSVRQKKSFRTGSKIKAPPGVCTTCRCVKKSPRECFGRVARSSLLYYNLLCGRANGGTSLVTHFKLPTPLDLCITMPSTKKQKVLRISQMILFNQLHLPDVEEMHKVNVKRR